MKLKGQNKYWEKIITIIYLCNNRLKSRIHKELLQFNYKKLGPFKDFSRYFNKEDTQMCIKYVKSFSISLIIKEMQIKTTVRKFDEKAS